MYYSSSSFCVLLQYYHSSATMYYSSTSLFQTFERWYFNHHPFNHAPAKVFVEIVTVSTPYTSGFYCIDENVSYVNKLCCIKPSTIRFVAWRTVWYVVKCFYNCEGITARRWSLKMTKDNHQSSHVRDTLFGKKTCPWHVREMTKHDSRIRGVYIGKPCPRMPPYITGVSSLIPTRVFSTFDSRRCEYIPAATYHTHSWPLICQNWWVPFAYIIAPHKRKNTWMSEDHCGLKFHTLLWSTKRQKYKQTIVAYIIPKKLTSKAKDANTMINLGEKNFGELLTQLGSRRHDILPAVTKVDAHDQAPLDHSTSQYHSGHCLQTNHVLVHGG